MPVYPRTALSKAFLLLSAFFTAADPLPAGQPPPIFAFRFGSTGHDCGQATATDSSGNLILAGFFQSTVDFDPGPGTALLQSHSRQDMVIAKYNKIGRLLWAKDVGGTADVTPRSVAVDPGDNIIVVGDFGIGGGVSGTADFDPGTGVADLVSSGGRDPFIAKYDPDGNYLWARPLSGVLATALDSFAWDIAVDGTGSIYVTGSLQGTLDLDASPGSAHIYTSQGGSDIFLVKYNGGGDFVWGFGLGANGDDEGLSVSLDGAGNVFISGIFSNTVDFDPGPGISLLNSAGNTDIFIASYTTQGVFENAVRLGGAQPETMSPGAMRADVYGNLFLAGQFRGKIDFGGGSDNLSVTNNSPVVNSFVAAYTPSLTARWAFSVASQDGPNTATRVGIDAQGNIWVAGWFSGTADFDGSSGVKALTGKGRNGATDIFLAKYNGDGNLLWVQGFGAALSGAENFSFAAGMALDKGCNAFVTGQFFGLVDFDPSSHSFYLTSGGSNDGFVAKYDAQGNLLPTLLFPRIQTDVNRYIGIAVANWGETPADIEFVAFDNDGSKSANPPGIVNPSTLTIPAGSQIALLSSQIFGLPSDRPYNGWARAQSSSSQVTGFFLGGNSGLTLLDGATAGNATPDELFFTRGHLDSSTFGSSAYRNRFDIVNPNPVSARLELRLLDQYGGIRATATRVLSPHGRMSEELTALFPSIGPPVSWSYVRVACSVGVNGFETIETDRSLFALPAQPRSTQRQLISAQFASGQTGGISYFTSLNLINTSDEIRTLLLNLIGNEGSLVGLVKVLVLAPGEQYQSRGDVTFGLPDPVNNALTEGSLIINSDGPGIIGDVAFGDPVAGKFLASLPLEGNPVSDFVFSQVAQGSPDGGKPYFTGIAIFNPNSTTANITIDVYSERGKKTGTTSVDLPAGNRLSKTLPQLVPSILDQVRGYIRVSSTSPIVAFELFGDQVLDFLAAIPPQPISP